MRNEKLRLTSALTILLALFPCVAQANMVWPSLYIFSGMLSWYIIVAGLIVETLFVKFILKLSWVKSTVMSVGMNLASAVLGFVAIPLSGILVEIILLPLGGGTFNPLHWIGAYAMAILCNVLIEGNFLKFVFKLNFKENFKWLFIANSISIILTVFVLLFDAESVAHRFNM